MANRRSRIRVVKRLNQYLKSLISMSFIAHGWRGYSMGSRSQSNGVHSLNYLLIKLELNVFPATVGIASVFCIYRALTTILIRQAPSQALFDISPGLVEQTINSETKIEVLEMIYLASIGLNPWKGSHGNTRDDFRDLISYHGIIWVRAQPWNIIHIAQYCVPLRGFVSSSLKLADTTPWYPN